MFKIALLAIVLLAPFAQVEPAGPLLRGVDASQVFEVCVQYRDGADYHCYAYVDAVGAVCDVSRPDGVRACGVDFAALLAPFIAWQGTFVPNAPPDLYWWWDWNVGAVPSPNGQYTEVLLAIEIKAYDAANDAARRWWLACSVLDAERGICLVQDRIDHFNWVAVPANDIWSLVGWMAGGGQ